MVGGKSVTAQQVCYQDKEGNLFCRNYTGLPMGGENKIGENEGGFRTEVLSTLSPRAVRINALPQTTTTVATVVPATSNLQAKTVTELASMMKSKDVKTRLEALSGIDRSLYASRTWPRDPYWSKLIDSFIRVNIKPNGKLPNEPDIILALDIMSRHYQIHNWSGIGGIWPCVDNCGKPITPCYAYPEIQCTADEARQIKEQVKQPTVYKAASPQQVQQKEPDKEIVLQETIEFILPKEEKNSPTASYTFTGTGTKIASEDVAFETTPYIDRSFIHFEPSMDKPMDVPPDEVLQQIDVVETVIIEQKEKEDEIVDKKIDPVEVVYDEYSCSPGVCRTRLEQTPDWTALLKKSAQTLSTDQSEMGDRLTAICTLKCIADDQRGETEEGIMHFLSRYVRRRAPFSMLPPDQYQQKPMTQYVRADVKASLHVLTARNRTKGLKSKIDLTGTDLRGVNLACRANLADVSLVKANLEGTDLRNATGTPDPTNRFATGVFSWDDIYLAAIDVTTRLPKYLESPDFRSYKNPKVPETPSREYKVTSEDCTWWEASIAK